MTRLSWNEIRSRAAAFAREWADAAYEKGETHSFYNEFFEIFGVRRRTVARYEEHVRRLDDTHGFIDLFWPGVLLVEQKSAGRDLAAARGQAGAYFDALPERDRPRYQLLCDFRTFELLDRDEREETRFALADLPAHVEKFGFVLGVQRRTFRDQDPVNVEASELVARLHDALEASGYDGRDLELFLVRIVFCLFADDTGIFEPRDVFLQFVEERTASDGSDLGPWLARLFQVLDTPEDRRQAKLDEDLARFPYVDGDLFAGPIRIPDFDAAMRRALLDAGRFDWTAISPAIFGALFQSVMDPAARRAAGAHYTTERNILKVIEPLFLDDLRAEFARLRARSDSRAVQDLLRFQERLGALRFFDPACGCGNFLIIAYRELRALEMEVLRELRPGGQFDLIADTLSVVDVDQFHGIEIGEFPARIAATALWMMDHIMNARLSLEFGLTYARIPIEKSPNVRCADALEIDWAEVLPPGECDYVFGNPPFGGAKYQSPEQRAQVRRIAALGGAGGTLDYVAAWFVRAGEYVRRAHPEASRARLAGPADPARPARAPGSLPAHAGMDRITDGSQVDGPSLPAHAGMNPSNVTSGARTRKPPAGVPRTGHAAGRPRAARAPGSLPPRIGFVATNSITQGEQAAQLWPILFDRQRLEISFAHRTFAWGSDARGVAHVHVTIIGLDAAERGSTGATGRRLFTSEDGKGEPLESRHAAITPYLFDGGGLADPHLVVREEGRPINGLRQLLTGSQPIDGGLTIFDAEERLALLDAEPDAAPFLRPFVGAREYLQGGERWILALHDASPGALARLPRVRERIAAVRAWRRTSKRKSTLKLADTPTLWQVNVLPTAPFLVLPEVSSERREYVPIGWLEPPVVPSNLVRVLEGATKPTFALLTSAMHMAWLRHVGGRLESRYRYSVGLVYNTFPTPPGWTERQRGPLGAGAASGAAAATTAPAGPNGNAARPALEPLAQAVLDARAAHPDSTLAELYDPDLMPPNLRRAHRALDRAVDRLYRRTRFASERERVEHLFALYERLRAPLAAAAAGPKRRSRRRALRSR